MDAYTVSVRLALIDGVTTGLMGLSRAFAKVHGDAGKLQKQLDLIKFRMVAGAALAGTGLFGLNLLGKTLPYAKEYARQLALMNTLGMRQAEIARVVSDAWKTSYAVPTSTAAQNLASFRELRSAFGSDAEGQRHASAMLPVVARLQAVMQSLTGREQEHVGFDMVKAIELRTGVMTTAALQRNAELMSRTIIGMGGTLSVADFHGALKMGKIATNKWDDDFTYNYLPTLMQELKTASGGGAQSAGTALMSLYQQMHGRMTKAAMPLWVQSGLVRQGDIVKNAGGQYQVKPGAVAGTSLFEANPFQWVQQFLRPAIDKLMAARHISAETAINSMFSNRNAAFAAYNMYFKAAQYERDKTTISKADGGYAAYQKLLKTDPTLASQALHAQWQNILAQIGYSIMPTLIKGSLMLVGALKDLSSVMRAHPTAVKVLVGAFAGLSILTTIAGGVLLFSGAITALSIAWPIITAAFAAGFAMLGGAIGAIFSPVTLVVGAIAGIGVAIYEIVKHWDKSKSIIDNIKNEAAMLWKWIGDKVHWLIGLLPGSSGPAARAPNGASNYTDLRPKPGQHGAAPSNTPDLSAHPHKTPASSPVVYGAAGAQVIHISNVTTLDGRVVAESVNRINARDFNRAQVGSTGIDPRASLPMAARYA